MNTPSTPANPPISRETIHTMLIAQETQRRDDLARCWDCGEHRPLSATTCPTCGAGEPF